VAITPDTKDWTWVLREPCRECGFSAADLPPKEVGARLRADLRRWEAVLRRRDARTRPDDATWSPTEYACHLRDVCGVVSERVQLMLDEDAPVLASWDQDEAAVASHYAARNAPRAAGELFWSILTVNEVLSNVPDEGWRRPGLRDDGVVFTVASLARYLAHESVHHLVDVRG